MLIGKRLAELKEELNLTNQQFEKAVHASNASMGNWISGKYLPKADSIYAIAQFCGVSADYLLGLSDDRNPPKLEEILSEDERLLLKAFRMADREGQHEIIYACRLEMHKAEERRIKEEGPVSG